MAGTHNLMTSKIAGVTMDIRYSIHPDHMKSLDTKEMRKHFLIDRLFEKDKVNLVYSHIDRIIAGGVCPADTRIEAYGDKRAGRRYVP